MRIAVTVTDEIQTLAAKRLAARLHLPFVTTPTPSYDFALVLTPTFLGIQNLSKNAKLFHVDFTQHKIAYRLKKGTRRSELLIKAMGNNASQIVDATAGFGLDSFLLAAFGYHVIVLEQSPIVHALLFDAFLRAAQIDKLKPIFSRLKLIHTNAITYLQKIKPEAYPDIIYLDPMFPSKSKTAQVKKEMQILQYLVDQPTDDHLLFEVAATCARQRVVVKRPRKGQAISEVKPNFSLLGSSSRFDVYIKPSSPT